MVHEIKRGRKMEMYGITDGKEGGRMPRRRIGRSCLFGFAIVVGSMIAAAVADETIEFNADKPTLDRWNYPFNQTPGVRELASIWGATIPEEPNGFSPDFDNRDAQFHVGFATDESIPTDLGPESYHITEAVVTIMIGTNNTFRYDPTYDIWQSYLPVNHPDFIPDDTTGRPMELYGVGFRNGFDALSYTETTAYSTISPFGKFVRTTYAMDFDAQGEPRDVSNNIDEMFDPSPFAIGQTDTVAPGAFVPQLTVFTFTIDVEDELIQNYLRESLDLGIVHFMFSSLHAASDPADNGDFSSTYPEILTKENLFVMAGLADASQLSLTVEIIDDPGDPGVIGDLNGDGVVNVFDLLLLLEQWGVCADPENCPADLDGSGTVNVFDLLILLENWG
ncbi:MAG: hypothetical protein EA377_11825 [Phycisphaerales bacterium]|nr:MAG: hypothetical protein EA377_11825 [Phycisphaerales bacterium]